MTNPAAGWYPDPNDPAQHRYWNGTEWTEVTPPIDPRNRGRSTAVDQTDDGDGTWILAGTKRSIAKRLAIWGGVAFAALMGFGLFLQAIGYEPGSDEVEAFASSTTTTERGTTSTSTEATTPTEPKASTTTAESTTTERQTTTEIETTTTTERQTTTVLTVSQGCEQTIAAASKVSVLEDTWPDLWPAFRSCGSIDELLLGLQQGDPDERWASFVETPEAVLPNLCNTEYWPDVPIGGPVCSEWLS